MKKTIFLIITSALVAIPVAASARLYSSDPPCNADADRYARLASHGRSAGDPFYENYRDNYLLTNCPGVEDDGS